jgi:hypothetical protein
MGLIHDWAMRLGSFRADALYRVWALIWAQVWGIVLAIVTIVAFVWMVVDVVLQFVLNMDFLTASSRPADIVNATLEYETDLLKFAFTGQGEWMWLPRW